MIMKSRKLVRPRPLALIATGLACLALPIATQAQEPRDTAYRCTEEFSGGLAFDAANDRWRGNAFRVFEKFTLQMRFMGTTVRKSTVGDGRRVSEFDVYLADATGRDPQPCFGGDGRPVAVENGQVSCKKGLYDYKFNLTTNRFLYSYMIGYIDGRNDNENTPHITGGTCARAK
jgi:hypothetical protein